MSTLKYPLVTIIMQKAVIITGGKQFLVSVGDTIKSEKIDTKEKNLKLTEVLAVSDGQKYTFGTPFIKDASVEVEVVKQFKDCLLYTSPSPRDGLLSRMPSSA